MRKTSLFLAGFAALVFIAIGVGSCGQGIIQVGEDEIGADSGHPEPNCGECPYPKTCGGGGVPNVCGCTPETDAAFCARLGTGCGRATGTDNCGDPRTASCGECMPSCGNQGCEGGEDCASCSADCGACPAKCSNGKCEAGEDCSSCSVDCGACPADCGNQNCEAGEDCTSCRVDCGACPVVCGNQKCEEGEDCASCAADCGACPVDCGNQKCEAGEDCNSCPADCGACPAVCGDQTCEAGEDCASCPVDCGVLCTTPPPRICFSASVLRIFESQGTCGQDGQCEYSYSDTTCPKGCEGDQCKSCVAETDAAFCVRLGKNCDSVSGADNCGTPRNAACGSCTEPETCGGGGTANVCGRTCIPESDADFCRRLKRDCGSVGGTDNCGTVRPAVSCGEPCGQANCGNYVCEPEGGEDCQNCRSDCGACLPAGCGNGFCEYGESCDDGNIYNDRRCAADCSVCSGSCSGVFGFCDAEDVGPSGCGDPTYPRCVPDCGVCQDHCGNGGCEIGEHCGRIGGSINCAADCGECGPYKIDSRPSGAAAYVAYGVRGGTYVGTTPFFITYDFPDLPACYLKFVKAGYRDGMAMIMEALFPYGETIVYLNPL